MKDINDHLKEISQFINQINVNDAFKGLSSGDILIDIREADEVATGSPIGAIPISKGMLEIQIYQHLRDPSKRIMLMCASGKRSLLAAHSLLQLGLKDVCSVSGGFNQWKNQSLPFEIPPTLSKENKMRYKRHLLIPEVGQKGQLELLKSKVLIVGAGGIGSPTALYLAAAGIGTIGIVDDDIIDPSNLQRQILFSEKHVGSSKAKISRERLMQLNSSITINSYDQRLDADSVEHIFSQYDIIIDGSDNFETRYLVNDACVKLNIPNIHGAVFLFEGQFSTFWPSHRKNAPCYRCLYPSPPPAELAPSCAEAGVFGVLPGLIGLLCATEALKLIMGLGENQVGKLLIYDALKMNFNELEIDKKVNCPYCGCTDIVNYPSYSSYPAHCSTSE